MNIDIDSKECMFVIYGKLEELNDFKKNLLEIPRHGFDAGYMMMIEESLAERYESFWHCENELCDFDETITTPVIVSNDTLMCPKCRSRIVKVLKNVQ